jgi:hypothetical protein
MQSERNLNPITFHFNYWGLRVTGECKTNCKSECKSDLHYISFYVLGLRFYWVLSCYFFNAMHYGNNSNLPSFNAMHSLQLRLLNWVAFLLFL